MMCVIHSETRFYAAASAEKQLTTGDYPIKNITKICDRNGGLLYETYDPRGGRRTLIKPEQVTPLVKAAFVATEDATFDTNPGVEPQAIARAALHLAIYYEITGGGSTITQQLVKNMLLTPDQTWERNIREAILAAEVTRRYPQEKAWLCISTRRILGIRLTG